MSGPTVGPWFVGQRITGELAVVGDRDSVVCDFRGRSPTPYEDARLIAAVPELLAAAREADELLRGMGGMSRNNIEQMAAEAMQSLQAAIAKATQP